MDASLLNCCATFLWTSDICFVTGEDKTYLNLSYLNLEMPKCGYQTVLCI